MAKGSHANDQVNFRLKSWLLEAVDCYLLPAVRQESNQPDLSRSELIKHLLLRELRAKGWEKGQEDDNA